MNKTHTESNPRRVTKACEECGKTYELPLSRAGRSRFCSRYCQCSSISRRKTPEVIETRICPACGKEYQTTNRHGGRKTCSQECANKRKVLQNGQPRKGKSARVECAHCGKERYVSPSRVDGRNFFCNHKCKAAYQLAQGSVEIQCQVCGKAFTVARYWTRQDTSRNAKYCSRECMGEALSINRRGENNFNWVGGCEQPTWRGDNWWKQARKAKKLDRYTCKRCERVFPPKSGHLDVHHIVPFRLFGDDFELANRLDNLICLCRSCHGAVESATRSFLRDSETEDTEKLRVDLIALFWEQKADSNQGAGEGNRSSEQ